MSAYDCVAKEPKPQKKSTSGSVGNRAAYGIREHCQGGDGNSRDMRMKNEE